MTPAKTATLVAISAFAAEILLSDLIFNPMIGQGVLIARAAVVLALVTALIVAIAYFTIRRFAKPLARLQNSPDDIRSQCVDALILLHITFSFQVVLYPLTRELIPSLNAFGADMVGAFVLAIIVGAASGWLRAVEDQTLQCRADNDSQDRSFNRTLTLSMVFAAICLGFLPMIAAKTQQISVQKSSNEAELINIAGRQRMFSQRIVLLSTAQDTAARDELSEAISTARREADRLNELADAFLAQHSSLSNDQISLSNLGQLANLRNSYLDHAEQSLEPLSPQQRSEALTSLRLAVDKFLPVMDQTVQALQKTSEDNVANQASSTMLRVLLGPFVFIGLVVGLFWPLLRFVRVQRKVLKASRKEAEEASVKAQAASTAKSQFLATMSHEIRTPMNGVIGMLDVLLQSELSKSQRGQADVAHRSALSLLAVINDVLDFSKMEAGKLDLDSIAMNPAQILDDVMSLLAIDASEKGIGLNCRVEPAVPTWVKGDPTRFRQVLLNLLGNAVKFTKTGGVDVTFEFDKTDQGDFLRCTVSDTGIGISEEDQSALFDQFTQVDATTTREFGGTGLGLAICRQLTELMGGDMGVESQLGVGSTFWCTIQVSPSDGICAEDPIIAQPPPADNKQRRLLVVEDNLINQKIVTAYLAPFNAEIVTVLNGAEAVEAIKRTPFDVVIMDIQMPVMDGLEATREIRALPEPAGSIPIIAVTANAMKGDREKYLATGMNGYVSKPINVNELFRAIRNCTQWDRMVPTQSDKVA